MPPQKFRRLSPTHPLLLQRDQHSPEGDVNFSPIAGLIGLDPRYPTLLFKLFSKFRPATNRSTEMWVGAKKTVGEAAGVSYRSIG